MAQSKDALNSMLFFALLVVVVFSFSFDPNAEESRAHCRRADLGRISVCGCRCPKPDVGSGTSQPGAGCLSGFPGSGQRAVSGEGDWKFLFVAILEALMTPLFIIFYKLRALGPAWQLLPVAILGTWAIVVNGTFFAAMSLRTRSREIMLPLLLFPITIPALLSMVEATTAILVGDPTVSAKFWIVLLATYDVVFTTGCLALFETVLHAE